MDRKTGKANHIEDYLVTVREGQWFGWSDSKNKVYANLVVHDGGAKPSEADCTNGLKALQDAWDLENASYKIKRREYDWLIIYNGHVMFKMRRRLSVLCDYSPSIFSLFNFL